MALLKCNNLPGQQVWAAYIGDAMDRLDVAASASKVSTAFLALAPLCGKQVQPVTGAAKAISEILDPKGLDAFNRMQRRSEHASCDFWRLLWGQNAAAWETRIKQSFAAGMSLDLEEATVKYQLVYEHCVPLQSGRYLCFPADSVGLAVSLKHTIQYRQADGSLGEMEVDLLFPGTARTVVRLMEAWWDAKGGKPSTKEAKVAHSAA